MIRINLLPVRAEKRRENIKRHYLLLGLYVIFLFVVILGVQMSQVSIHNSRKATIQTQKSDIERLDATIKEVQNYNAKLADLTDKLNVVIGLEKKQQGPAKVFGELSKVVPEKLWIEKVTDMKGVVVIDGWALDQQTIAQFMMNLEASKVFGKVKLTQTKKANKGEAELQSFTVETLVAAPAAPQPVKTPGKAG